MSDASRALMVRLGCALGLLVAAACGRHGPLDRGDVISAEPLESTDTQAAVRAEADEVTAAALDTWSRALPPMSTDAPHELVMGAGAGADGAPDEEQMRHEPVGTTTITGADVPTSGAPTPTAPPRSASEAAERNEPGTPAPRSSGVPTPLAPTSPAETADPTR